MRFIGCDQICVTSFTHQSGVRNLNSFLVLIVNKNISPAFLAILVAASTISAFATPPSPQQLTYKDVTNIIAKSKGNVATAKRLLTGKTVKVKLDGGVDVFWVKAEDETFFVCEKGSSFKGGTVVATVVNYDETGGDSNPRIWLDKCSSAEGAAASVASGQIFYSHAGSAEKPEPFKKTGPAEISGKIVRTKDGGSWQYALVPAGKKPIRIDFETTDKLTAALSSIEDKGVAVVLKGTVGTFPGGFQAFDTTKPLTISAAP